MFDMLLEEQAMANVADYDSLVTRLMRERKATLAANEERERTRLPRTKNFPWGVSWHRRGTAN
jgi:hypothetical protein